MTSVYNGDLKKKTTKMHYFCILYTLMPLVDILNGILTKVLKSSFSVGRAYRFFLIAVILMLMVSYKKVSRKDFVPLVGVAVLIIILALVHVLMGGNISNELSNVLSWLLFPIYVFGFSLLDAHGHVHEEDRKKILEVWQWFFPLTILIPKLLNVGYNTYRSGAGYKSFYYSTNAVSFALSILVIYSLNRLYSEISVKNGIKFGLCAWACLTIGTKAGALSIIVAVIILLLEKLSWKHIKKVLVVVIILVVAYFVFGTFIQEKITTIVNRYNYFNRILNNVFIDSITTGRTGKARDLWTEIQNGGLACYILGLGYNNYLAEMDFFDLFFQFGILGVVAYILYVIHTNNTIKVSGIYRKLVIFSLIYAFVVGHVFNNAMSSMVFALIFYNFTLSDRSESVCSRGNI